MREVYVELVGDLKLLVGGKNGYVRVRGGQGPNKDQYQGYTPATRSTPRHPSRQREKPPWLSRSLSETSQQALTRRQGKHAKVSTNTSSNPA